MKPESMSTDKTGSTNNEPSVDNELDIRGLCRTLWRGKVWIIGMAIIFAAIALGVSYLVKQQWSATAITDKPTVNNLGGIIRNSSFYVILISVSIAGLSVNSQASPMKLTVSSLLS